MKELLGEVLREFYEFGIPEDVRPRGVPYLEKRNAATVVVGMRRTGKTYVTYERMRALVESGIPLERIVLETDGPYLSPEPKRGTRNVSSNIAYVIAKLSQIRGIPEEEVREAAWENAHRLYRMH